MDQDVDEPASLRAEQIAQTRAALITAGRHLFGTRGFAATSVDDLAAHARLTTGALYHHFSSKAALFEAVFEDAHRQLLQNALAAGTGASNEVDQLLRGFEAFLDAVVQPDLQRILILDAPAVLGLERFTELDERHAFPVLAGTLRAAAADRRLTIDHPDILARLLLGTLIRGAMLIATSPAPQATRDDVITTLAEMIHALEPRPRRR
jgi:AcrR family transcriptional regulator